MISIDIENNGFKDVLFYDIEVFKCDALVVFKDIDHNTVAVYHNDFTGIEDLIRGKVLVGYNNYYYDDYILSAMMMNRPVEYLKKSNDEIINEGITDIGLNKEIHSLDCFQQINVARSSLKKIEGNLGMSIEETSVPFDIDRPLTEEEYDLTLKYCSHDVDATIEIFKLRWPQYFKPKLMVVSMLPEHLQDYAIHWNTTTIAAQLLTDGARVKKHYEYKFDENKGFTQKQYDVVPEDLIQMWKDAERDIFSMSEDFKPGKYTFDALGCIFEFGFGGLHGVNKVKKRFCDVTLLDVTSMYPNIILKTQIFGEKVTDKYREIVEKRVAAKKTDKDTSDALKLVINSAYGLMKNEHSKLLNPIGAASVCIYGQIALFDLCTRLRDAEYTIVNVNTDGVAFTGGSPYSNYKDIQEEWERDYGLNLESSYFKKWIQKDVNNYVAQTSDGDIKVKGGDVNKYHDPISFDAFTTSKYPGFTWTGTNSLGIISRCVVEYVLNGITAEKTVHKFKHEPLLFQMILQAGSTFTGTIDKEGNEYQKVNRVFAAKDNGVLLQKIKEDGSTCRFPNAPENMYVFNGDLKEFTDFEDVVDYKYYINLASEVCERWNF